MQSALKKRAKCAKCNYSRKNELRKEERPTMSTQGVLRQKESIAVGLSSAMFL